MGVFHVFILYKWYQIAQNITYVSLVVARTPQQSPKMQSFVTIVKGYFHLYPFKIPENLWVFAISEGYKMGKTYNYCWTGLHLRCL